MTGAPLICTLTQGDTHGGIARVSELLWRASSEITGGACRRLTLFPHEAGVLTLAQRFRFATALWASQIQQRPAWILFDHLGIARPQALVPSSVRAPYVVFAHSLEVWQPLSSNRKRSLLNAQFLIANSQYTADRARALHPDLPPMHICHLALDEHASVSEGEAVNRDLIARIGPRSVLIVGRMASAERYKGHDELIEAWPAVLARAPEAQLVIVGQGDDAPRYQAKARALGIAQAVLFAGRVNEVTLHALYDRAAVFAMPARGEGFGLVYLEAMSHRLPVLASHTDAAAEIVVDGETGFLLDPGDRPAIVDRLAALLDDEVLRRRFGDAGHSRWRTQFSYERFRSRLAEILAPLRVRERPN